MWKVCGQNVEKLIQSEVKGGVKILRYREMLRQKRLENGLSLAALAEYFNVKSMTVGNWERGRTLPHPQKAREIAQIMEGNRMITAEEREELMQEYTKIKVQGFIYRRMAAVRMEEKRQERD